MLGVEGATTDARPSYKTSRYKERPLQHSRSMSSNVASMLSKHYIPPCSQRSETLPPPAAKHRSCCQPSNQEASQDILNLKPPNLHTAACRVHKLQVDVGANLGFRSIYLAARMSSALIGDLLASEG